ncbi:MAG: hypothetical protein P8M78_17995, partial [Myxococcota bacterium]|nr:hypothetical protein [Myxococcota bacterium]
VPSVREQLGESSSPRCAQGKNFSLFVGPSLGNSDGDRLTNRLVWMFRLGDRFMKGRKYHAFTF